MPPDNVLRTWGPNVSSCGERAGRDLDAIDTMQERIRKAGFTDVQEKSYKWPIGPWARDQKYKEAGIVNYQHWLSGMEGWCMWLLTKFGSPEPWSKEVSTLDGNHFLSERTPPNIFFQDVQVYNAKLRAGLKNPQFHIYQRA